jgi:hypothetical protein
MNLKTPANQPETTRHRRLAVLTLAGWIAAALPAPAEPSTPPDFSSFQIVSQRNIFDPNRTARSRSGSRRASQPATDSFSLVGIMSYEKGAFAFFEGTSPDYRKVLKPEGDIAGFKIAAISPGAATLSTGTNETVLKVGAQMRRDDTGRWEVLTEPAPGSDDSRAEGRGRVLSSRRRSDDSTQTNASLTTPAPGEDEEIGDSNGDVSEEMTDLETETNAPPAAAQSGGGGANNVLTRLMQRRAQEAQQLRQ